MPPSNTVWSVEELQLGSIVRGATDKGANLSQVLEARELQGLVAKMHALTVAAHEAYRALCLFYNTMAFGRHLAEVELALNRIRPELVATPSASSSNDGSAAALLAPQLPFFGAKTAAWYNYLRGAALESGRFAEHVDVDALAHRFGLETPPLLDLRTADTPYRPREDLYRFAKGVDTEMMRGFKKFADEKLPAEQYEEDNYGGGFVDEDE